MLYGNLTQKIGTITVSDGYNSARLKAVETGETVIISGGLYLYNPGEYRVMQLSGVSLPTAQVDFPCGNNGLFGRGYLTTSGLIVLTVAGSGVDGAVMFNFSYTK